MMELKKELQLQKIEPNKEIYISQGAFGEVYLGFDELAHTPFACKIISLEKISEQANQEAIIRKIKDQIVNMQIARNEHIVEFYQAKTSKRNIYIMCEYCNGDNLDRFLKNRGYLTEFQALNCFKEILQGFYNLRERNIVHRDMKPANLLMHNYSLKIADLGFSKSVENHEQLLESVVGSPLYMSPQLFQHKKYTQKTDIWSVGTILYEMLYGKNPFSGCMNLMELKQRVKKEIIFPQYPYISAETKKIIKRMLVIEEKDRIDWEFLFNEYLFKPPAPHPQPPQANFYTVDINMQGYFRESYFIESHQHLRKILRSQQLNKLSPFFETAENFFGFIYLCMKNKDIIEQYFNHFIQYRNEIAYLIVICSKLTALMTSANNELLSVYIYCTYMLIYKYAITLIEEMITEEGFLRPFHHKFEIIQNKFYYEKFITILLIKDRQLLSQEYTHFSNYFRAMLSRLSQANAILHEKIQSDLSGVYSSEHGEKRVIKFFLRNYFKKVHNMLKQVIVGSKKPKANEMISEEEEEVRGHVLPSIEVVVCRLIEEYLNNEELFNLKAQADKLRKRTNITAATFPKNLAQILFDCETTLQEGYFQQLSNSRPFEEESIMSFMSKEIKWNNIFIPSLP